MPYLLSLRYTRFPPRPVHAIRRFCYDVTQSDAFEYVVLFLVVCNVVEMCIWWRDMDPHLLLIKERANLFLAICFAVCNSQLFAMCPQSWLLALASSAWDSACGCHRQQWSTKALQIELILKVVGLGWKLYWASGWNKMDYVLVVLSILDLGFSYLRSSFLRIVKVFRLQKLLRLLRMTRMVCSPSICILVMQGCCGSICLAGPMNGSCPTWVVTSAGESAEDPQKHSAPSCCNPTLYWRHTAHLHARSDRLLHIRILWSHHFRKSQTRVRYSFI